MTMMRKLFFLFLVIISSASMAQDLGEDLLLKRFRKNKTLDSLQGLSGKSAKQRTWVNTLRLEILEIDNRLLRDYINEGTIDSRKSRLKMLINENNRLQDEQARLDKFLLTMYIVGGVLVLAIIISLVFFFRSRRELREHQEALHTLEDTYRDKEARYHDHENSENELVEELKNEVGSYREELSKASRFLVELRNEKIAVENNLEDLKESNARMKKDLDKAQKKLSKLEDTDNEAFEKLTREKQEAEHKFNDLYQQYEQAGSNAENYRKRLAEYEELVRKEKQERETVRQDLLSWIESKNEEIQQIKKANVRKEKEIREMREALSALLKDIYDKDQTLSQHLNLDVNDKDSVVKNIRQLLQSKNDEIALERRDKSTLQEEKSELQMKVDTLDRKIKEQKQEVEEKSELLDSEFSKRQKLEQQLHQMLSNLKNL